MVPAIVLPIPDIFPTDAKPTTNASNSVEAAAKRMSAMADGAESMQGLAHKPHRAGASVSRKVL
jgi:hypothetical protein